MTRGLRRSDCPVHFALEVFGDAWTLLIVRDLMLHERSSYSEFLRAGEGIATNILSERLSRLEEEGIIEKRAGAGQAPSRSYRLTRKGIDLAPVLMEIIGWSAKYDPKTSADPAFVRKLRRDRSGLEGDLRGRWQDGRSATVEAVAAKTRGGAKAGVEKAAGRSRTGLKTAR